MKLSHGDINNLLTRAINKGKSLYDERSLWVREVYGEMSGSLVYTDGKGKMFSRTYSIDEATNAVTLGDAVEVVEATSYVPVQTSTFSLGGMVSFSNAEVVTRRGPIFKAGDYADVGYSMTEQELEDAVEAFQPVPVDLDHHQTVLDGKLGMLKHVEMGEGGVLFGTVEFPRWLEDTLGDSARKVSCTWDRATKKLRKLALTDNPRLQDAVLFSAYATFAGARHSQQDIADLQSIHDLVVKQGAACQPAEARMSANPNPNPNPNATSPKAPQPISQPTQQEKKKMNLWDRLTKGKTQEQVASMSTVITPEVLAMFAEAEAEANTPANTPDPDPKVAQLEHELAAQRAQFAQIAKERREERATAAVDALIRSNKLYPSERAVSIAAFSRAIEDDERDNTLVTFSDAQGNTSEVTRSQLLEAQYNARPAHRLTTEQIAAFALPNTDPDKDRDKEKEVDRLLKLTAEGRAALAARQNGNGHRN